MRTMTPSRPRVTDLWTADLPVSYLHGTRDAARLEIRITREHRATETTTHAVVPYRDRLSMVATSTRMCGQALAVLDPDDDSVRRLIIPRAHAIMLARVWRRWHLNDMKAGCRHQRHVAARYSAAMARPYTSERYTASGRFFTLACPVTGYRFASAWLAEPLPTDRLIRRLAAIVADCPGAIVRDLR